MALFELLRRDDVPSEVAIDEAVEAAKELCGAEAPGFVNGILGAVAREEVARMSDDLDRLVGELETPRRGCAPGTSTPPKPRSWWSAAPSWRRGSGSELDRAGRDAERDEPPEGQEQLAVNGARRRRPACYRVPG